MKEVYEYISQYDEIMSFINEYRSKKGDNQILNIEITKNGEHTIIDVGTYDLKNDIKDIKTKIFMGKFDYYVLPRIIIRYNSFYKTGKEEITKVSRTNANYTNISTTNDKLILKNYPIMTINYIRKLIDKI